MAEKLEEDNDEVPIALSIVQDYYCKVYLCV